MPVYEYQCAGCNERFSRFFRSQSAAAAPVACAACGAAEARRLISAFQVHQSLKSQIESIDPRFEKQMDWADRHHKADDLLNRLPTDFSRPGG